MSALAISNSAAMTLPVASPHRHGHMKGMLADAMSNTGSSSITGNSATGQPPAGAAQGLFGSLMQTLEQIIGGQPASASTAPAATSVAGGTSTGTAVSAAGGVSPATAASPALAQNLGGFLHSLFQVLKQEGSGAAAGTAAAASSTGVNGAPAVTAAGQYQGSLASSVQALIQQVGSTGSASPAIANLDNSFSNLISGLNGNTASTASGAGGASATQSSNAALQGFLNNLLQNLQANGLQAPKLTGTNVNASV
jgi:hypothetical protein